MATSTATAAPDNTSTATFRTWGLAVSTALQALSPSLVKTTDTGQIDWTTVTVPGTTGTWAGYEIYRFTDSLQATQPVFLKVEYGTGNALTKPGFRISIGTATNGAGVISGPGASATTFYGPATTPSITQSTTPLTCYFSSDGSYLTIALFTGGVSNTSTAWIVIDRSRNADGSANGDGLYVRYGGVINLNNTNEGGVAFYRNALVGVLNAAGVQRAAMAGSFTSYVDGTDLYVCPVLVFLPRGEAPASALVMVFAADVGLGVTFTLTHLGATHTFISLGASGTGADGNNNAISIALRYE